MNKKYHFLLIVVLIIYSFACSSKTKDKGRFRVVDGKELFFNGDEQIIDRLVMFEGNEYYIKEDGTKVKNNWAIIDNDGTWAYFGAKGIMVKNGIWKIDNNIYIFDEDGRLYREGLVVFDDYIYYVTKEGYLLKN